MNSARRMNSYHRFPSWWFCPFSLPEAVAVWRQVRIAEVEAVFALACTLAVCVWQEWGAVDQVAMAVVIPVAMAFSVHGLNNFRGLGLWNWLYLPARVSVVLLGVAYSYQHYYHFFDELIVFGIDLRPAVAVTIELLTFSALIAHEAHSTRLRAITTTPTTVDPAPSGDEVVSVEDLVPAASAVSVSGVQRSLSDGQPVSAPDPSGPVVLGFGGSGFVPVGSAAVSSNGSAR